MKLSTFDSFKHMRDSAQMVHMEGENLRILQGILIEMIQDVDSVCTDLGIEYVLGGGSCLGAVRHNGFIPWDDDLDINMTRADYSRFAPAFVERFGEKYWLHDLYRKADYELCFPRIRLKGTVFQNRDDFDDVECGVPLDIFLIENTPDNGALRLIHGFVSMAMGFIYSCRRFAAHEKRYIDMAGEDVRTRKAFRFKIAVGKVLSLCAVHEYALLWDKWNGICVNNKSKHISIPVGRKHYFGELTHREHVYPTQRIQFEELQLPIPNDADEYMRRLYGDYMQVPAPEDRETHIVYAFDAKDRSK